jgi:hypothetical protein
MVSNQNNLFATSAYGVMFAGGTTTTPVLEFLRF